MTMKFQVETTVVRLTDVTLPEWIELAINGQKIDAIKNLRESSRLEYGNMAGEVVSLAHCKMIVESIMAGVAR